MTTRISLLSICVLFPLLAPLGALAQGVTHLGRSVDDHVHLVWVNDSEDKCIVNGAFRRLRFDGSTTLPYQVPWGRALIVTDVYWEGAQVTTTEAMQFAALDIHNREGTFLATVFRSTPVPITAANQFGPISGSDQILGGVVVAPGRILCARWETQSIGSEIPSTGQVAFMHVYGYLVNR